MHIYLTNIFESIRKYLVFTPHKLLKHDILSGSQFGFRKKRFTEIALLQQKEIIIN